MSPPPSAAPIQAILRFADCSLSKFTERMLKTYPQKYDASRSRRYDPSNFSATPSLQERSAKSDKI